MALALAAGAFSLFLLFLGKSPAEFFTLVWRGAFGSAFSFQNTLQRAAPLLLTALCMAVPAHLGLVVIGGGGGGGGGRPRRPRRPRRRGGGAAAPPLGA